MQLKIYSDYQTLSLQVAEEILNTVKNKPAAVLCLAAGDTPRLAYDLLAKKATDEAVDFTRCTFIGLDEWIGIPPENEGSCRYFLESRVFQPLHIQPAQIYVFDGLAADTAAECDKANKIIGEKGGIDLILVGVGMNGHIGFNEPGVSSEQSTHVTDLDKTTQSVGQKYFTTPVMIQQGITLGLKEVLESKRLIVMAAGEKKAGIIKKALEDDISIQVPASTLRNHANAWAMMDEAAAGMLNL